MENFKSDGINISATFTSEDPNELEVMKAHLKGSGLPELNVDYTFGKNILKIQFVDRE